MLLSIWALSPLPLYFKPTFFGMIRPWESALGFVHQIGMCWLFIGVAGVILRSIQLFFIRDLQTGLVWAVKIMTGRVGMWRGGGRSTMSVAAPFVWRCLSGSAITPFPHPAHRTQRADLSGSAAIAGFCPHRTHRAALPQWALQEGPEAD